MIGIYSILNTINKKRYIGQSINISKRFIQHKRELNNNQHINSHLQASWNKYGEDSFTFIVIEKCSKEELDSKEKEWIMFYKSDNSAYGYNLDSGGQGVSGFKHTYAQLEKMRSIQNPMVVLQFDENFQFVNRYSGGASHIYKELGYTRSSIISRCQHKSKNLLYKNCYWVYEEEYLSNNFSWKDYLNNNSNFNYSKIDKSPKSNKKIYQYDLNKNLVKVWNNFSEIEQAGYIRHQVNAVCNRRAHKRTHRGYIWTYEDVDMSDEYFNSINFTCESNKKRSKPVCQWDKNKNKIREYSSITEAAKEFHTNSSVICKAITNHTVSMGYFWEHKSNPWIELSTDNLIKKYNDAANAQKKDVIQYDQDYNIVNVYPSLSEAAKKVGSSAGNISRAISNPTQMCKGFYWRKK